MFLNDDSFEQSDVPMFQNSSKRMKYFFEIAFLLCGKYKCMSLVQFPDEEYTCSLQDLFF